MKKINEIVVLMLFLFIFVGCGAQSLSDTMNTETYPPKRYTVTSSIDSTVKPEKHASVITSTPVVATATHTTTTVIATKPVPTPLPTTSNLEVLPTQSDDEFDLSDVIYIVKFSKPKPSSEIRTINSLVGDKETLVQLDHQASSVLQSPDKQYVSWIGQQFDPYRRSVWLMGPDQMPKQLTPWSEDLGSYQWSPDSQQVFIWDYDPKGPLKDVYAVSINTQDRMPIWFDAHPFDTIANFKISPNGEYVAYVLWDDPKLIVQDKAGNVWNIQELQAVPWMAWSPDSQWLAYTDASTGDKQDTLFVTSPTGEENRKLMSGKRRVGRLVWSPSSSRLAFVADTAKSCYIDTKAENPKPSCLRREVWSGENPVWLSDNQWMLSTNQLDKEWDIYRILLSDESFVNISQDGNLASDLSLWESQIE